MIEHDIHCTCGVLTIYPCPTHKASLAQEVRRLGIKEYYRDLVEMIRSDCLRNGKKLSCFCDFSEYRLICPEHFD